jgi:hypothetical protein
LSIAVGSIFSVVSWYLGAGSAFIIGVVDIAVLGIKRFDCHSIPPLSMIRPEVKMGSVEQLALGIITVVTVLILFQLYGISKTLKECLRTLREISVRVDPRNS